ncbi:hypothetical protein JY419_20575 [Stenotrophomonas maltophilia]|nr:hypothetical protein [Stenotrophomonas maltophilia]
MKFKTAIRWYDVASCGYYKHGDPSAPVFGDLDYLMNELVFFSKKKKLADTQMLSDPNSLKTYIAGIAEKDGIYAIVLWNQVQGDGKSVNSLPADALVGEAKAEKSRVKKGNIPGFPTYFLVIPSRGVVGTLRIVDNVPGLDAFRRYCALFLENASRGVVTELVGSEVVVEGYRATKKDPVQALHPRLVLQVKRDKTRAQYIRDNADKVRKVVRVRTLDVAKNPSDFTAWQHFLKLVGLSSNHASRSEMRVKNEVDVNNDEKAIIKLVDDNEHLVVAKENDFGFVFSGSAEPHWLSSAICGASQELDVEGVNGVYSASSIANGAAQRKAALLSTIK